MKFPPPSRLRLKSEGLRIRVEFRYPLSRFSSQQFRLQVDFDRTKHLADKSIRRRRMEREKLGELERQRSVKAAADAARIEAERSRLDEAAFQRRRQREEKRRVRALEKVRGLVEERLRRL